MLGRGVGWCCVVLLLWGGGVTARAQGDADGAVEDPLASLDRLVEEAARRLGQRPASGQVELTLDEAIRRALDLNLDIAVQRIGPQVVDLTLAEQLAFYRPTVRLDYDTTSSTTPSSFQLDGGLVTLTDTANMDVGVVQPVRWGGGTFDAGFFNNRRDTTNTFSSFNPSFRSVFFAQYTQPLLRGLRRDDQRQQIRITQVNREIAEVDLRQTIANTVAQVGNAYWLLLYAQASVDVQRQALDLAEQLVEDNRKRVAVGALAPIDVVQAQSQAAVRRQILAQAEQSLATAEIALKQLIVDGTQDPLWRADVVPIDQPQLSREPIDIEAAIRRALADRTDFERARRQQTVNELTVEGLQDRTLPTLNLVAAYQLQGQGGNFLIRGGELGGEVVGVVPGGYGDALNQLLEANFPVWSVGLQLNYPLGNNADRAALERARLQVRQTDAQIRQVELLIAAEVTTAGLQIQRIQDRIEAAATARELAERQLAAEERRFEAGTQTNFFVVQAQRDLAAAQDTELRAILDYQRALIEFERVQKTSLSNAGIAFVGSGAGGAAGAGQTGAGGQLGGNQGFGGR